MVVELIGERRVRDKRHLTVLERVGVRASRHEKKVRQRAAALRESESDGVAHRDHLQSVTAASCQVQLLPRTAVDHVRPSIRRTHRRHSDKLRLDNTQMRLVLLPKVVQAAAYEINEGAAHDGTARRFYRSDVTRRVEEYGVYA